MPVPETWCARHAAVLAGLANQENQLSHQRTFIVALSLLAAQPAFAQSGQSPSSGATPLGVAAPAAKVPPLVYRSVFDNAPLAAADKPIDWRSANAEVGRMERGHIDILKWEAQQESAATAKAAPGSGSAPASPAPAAAASAPRQAPAPDLHRPHHGGGRP